MDVSFWETERDLAATSWRTLLLGIAVLNLFWWAADAFIYHGDPKLVAAMLPLRVHTSGLAFTLYFLIPRSHFLRRHTQGVLVTAVLIVGFHFSWVFSALGGPGTLWFPLTFPILIIPMAMSFKPETRLVVMLLFGAAFALGYYGRTPTYLSDPYAWTTLSYLFFVVVVGFSAGLVAQYWRRDAFFLRLETERQGLLLSDMNKHLESRVSAQTAELRLLAQNLESARETERAHIARELHDELGQQMTGLRYALKFTQLRYDTEPLAIRPHLQNLQEVLGQLTTTTRELVKELRPKVLDDLGLVSAVEWLVQGFGQRTGVAAEMRAADEELPLDREANVAAFRLVQEALTNIARHAQAQKVVVSIVKEGAEVVLRIVDDGQGFDPSLASEKGGSGLIGMRERIRAVGGQLVVESGRGRGTIVTARLVTAAPQELSA
jgi:signal transduction histidine kinase